MRPFDFESAKSEQAAIDSRRAHASSRYLAGGTTLMDLMKLEVETPEVIVDLTGLGDSAKEMRSISLKGDSIMIGALVTNADLANHSMILKRVPVLSKALLSGASPQLRNLATTAGNLRQRTRCSYFRDLAWACNKREPGSGCSAFDGVNRSHAILGGSEKCIATAPSDMNVALTALDAKIHVKGDGGKSRAIAIGDFFLKPGATPNLEHALTDSELITHVEIPLKDWYKRSHYVKVRDRASYAFALASAAVIADMSGKTMRDVRVAFGGFTTVPWRSAEAEAILKGKTVSVELFQKAADAALAGAVVRPHNAFKLQLAKSTLIRAFEELGALT